MTSHHTVSAPFCFASCITLIPLPPWFRLGCGPLSFSVATGAFRLPRPSTPEQRTKASCSCPELPKPKHRANVTNQLGPAMCGTTNTVREIQSAVMATELTCPSSSGKRPRREMRHWMTKKGEANIL